MGGRYGDWSLAIYAQPTFDAIAAATAAPRPDPSALVRGRPSYRLPRFFPVSEEYVAALVAQGFSPEDASYLRAMFDLMRRGLIAEVTDGVDRVLGRKPRDFESYVARVAAVGAWR